jgi:hypothetical protein
VYEKISNDSDGKLADSKELKEKSFHFKSVWDDNWK